AGPARDEADAGPAGRLADGFGGDRGRALVPADGHRNIAVVEGVERGEITFTRHAEGLANAVNRQLVDQNLAAGPHIVLARHRKNSKAASNADAGFEPQPQ